MMRTHPKIGGDTLRKVIEKFRGNSFLTMGMEIAYHHHEHWNGGGYPRHLPAGEVATLTLAEYLERDARGRRMYRLFRNPLVMFGLGPILSFVVLPRLVPKDARPRVRLALALVGVHRLVRGHLGVAHPRAAPSSTIR